MSDPTNAIRSLDQERCAALLARDFATLDRLLAADLVHVHAKGRIEDRAAYLNSVRNNLEFIGIERGELDVRVYGDAAVMVGPLRQSVRVKATGQVVEMNAIVTQVWVRQGSGWKQASFHICERHGA